MRFVWGVCVCGGVCVCVCVCVMGCSGVCGYLWGVGV